MVLEAVFRAHFEFFQGLFHLLDLRHLNGELRGLVYEGFRRAVQGVHHLNKVFLVLVSQLGLDLPGWGAFLGAVKELVNIVDLFIFHWFEVELLGQIFPFINIV